MCSEERGPRRPPRPAIPLAFWALVTVVVTERSVLVAEVAPWWAAVSACLVTMLGVWRAMVSEGEEAPGWGWSVAACGASCALALGVSSVALARGTTFVEALGSSSVSSWTFEVTSDATETRYGMRVRARAVRGEGPSGDVWLSSSETFARGELVVAVGRFSAAEGERGASDRMQGVWGRVKVVRVLRRSMRGGPTSLPLRLRTKGLEVILPGESEERALLAGCVLGYREAMRERGLDKLFSACGVAHLVAVSGAHISTVAALVMAVLSRMRLRPVARLSMTLVVGMLFVLVCGAPPSAVRALLMAASAAGATVVGRRADGLSAATVAGIVMALCDPYVAGQMGFILSISCVVALCVFGRYATYVVDVVVPQVRLPRGTPSELRIKVGGIRASCVATLAASLVCQTASLPIVLPAFARLSLVGPLSSLVVTLPVTAMMATGLLGVCLGWVHVLSVPLLVASDFCARVVLASLRLLATLPLASLAVDVGAAASWGVVLAGAAGLLVVWPRVRVRVLRTVTYVFITCAVLLLVRWRLFAPARICVLDVGQGDAILVQDGMATILVDTGPEGSLARAVTRNHVLHLDAVVLTHLHDDHYGGVADLVGLVSCDHVYVAEGAADNVPDELRQSVLLLTPGGCEELRYGDALRVGSFELAMVWPRAPAPGTENADSIELVVRYEGSGRILTGLLTGDAEREETGAVIAAGDVGDVDFLKVGHHGSEVSLTEAEAEALAPELAVASAGEGNKYGHPREECVRMLEGVGATFLCTKDVGDVEVRPGSDGPVVRCQRS